MSLTHHDSNTRMSQIAFHNGTVYLAGQVPGRPPVRAAVEAPLAKPEWKVEIMVVAALPEA
ncbi:hypothetical protein [Halomonas stenophila]|uniref:Enamine deaminase RidA (YjgF/YER057c/UK114 family) n=1 Tax=Halomonas stenophila TaxID=795312 RepID=A0A7W5HM86_9GAMM|nr:hypothetical protein [Halomonas stenophila]MBB3232527.1 enamine deaminase RidA (YjgF/YER057c/UK114 family) [Halomonas stenophila]